MRVVQSKTGTWEVVRELGRGGMGRTVLVHDRVTGRQAVLKELHLAHLDDWKALEMFRREAALLAALDHPGVPRTLDVIDEGDGTQGLLQTFLDGQTLQQIIDEGGPLSPERFEAALRDCLDILAYLHGRVPPVIHRDITPRNVMLGAQRASIIDFGSVKWALRESTQLTSVGTFGYMAPEQTLGRAEPASDLYALGMTFVALATRRDPSQFEVDPQTGRVDVASMLRLEPRIATVLDRMTRPGLAERLTDAREALRLLDRLAPAQPLARTADSLVAQADAPVAKVRSPLVFFASAALLVLGIGGAVMSSAVSFGPVEEAAPSAPSSPPREATAAPPAEASPEPTPEDPPEPEPAPVVPSEVRAVTEAGNGAVGTAQVRLDSRPNGATVRLPGNQACQTPCRADVPYGKHTFRFVHGDRTVTRELMVIEDTSLLVSF